MHTFAYIYGYVHVHPVALLYQASGGADVGRLSVNMTRDAAASRVDASLFICTSRLRGAAPGVSKERNTIQCMMDTCRYIRQCTLVAGRFFLSGFGTA